MRGFAYLAAWLLVFATISAPSDTLAAVEVGVSVNFGSPPPPPPPPAPVVIAAPPLVAIAPPPLPVYVVPPPPFANYIWTLGYWYWSDAGYFWVPGTWVQPPVVGVLWTPGYWGWSGGSYIWHAGYWGPHVGFYGGVNYGGGYNGVEFVGGRWNGGVYVVDHAAINAPIVSVSASFNGGPGGVAAVPTPQQEAFAHENHMPLTSMQMQHITAAGKNPDLAASVNHGKPSIAATVRAGDFTHGIVAARQAGARNVEAEQHNIAVKKNPALAKGAALPRANNDRSNEAHSPKSTMAPSSSRSHQENAAHSRAERPDSRAERPEGRPAQGGDSAQPRREPSE